MNVVINTSLEDLFKGKPQEISFKKNIYCQTCDGFHFFFFIYKTILTFFKIKVLVQKQKQTISVQLAVVQDMFLQLEN